MAANKFATMLHRTTNNITLILIYAALEWILIVLLLLNSLFSYLIIKFANYFGLKPPCLWCSRVDYIIEKGQNNNMNRDLLCEDHANEIVKLGYCSNHRKLAEAQSMCEDCSSSRPDFHEKDFTILPWMKQYGIVQNYGQNVSDKDEENFKCSCCGLSFNDPFVVIKPSWGVLDCTLDGNLTSEGVYYDLRKEGNGSDRNRSDSLMDRFEDEEVNKFDREIEMLFDVNGGFGVGEEKTEEDYSVRISAKELEDHKKAVSLEAKEVPSSSDYRIVEVSGKEDASLEILSPHLEFFLDCSGHRLVPVELIDSAKEEDQSKNGVREGNHRQSVLEDRCRVRETEERFASLENKDEHKFSVFESVEGDGNKNSQETETLSKDVEIDAVEKEEREGRVSYVAAVSDEVYQVPANEKEAGVAFLTEISNLNAKEQIKVQETFSSFECKEQNLSTSSAKLDEVGDHGSRKSQDELSEAKVSSVKVCEDVSNHKLLLSSELNEIDEERVLDTPTSTESFHHLHKKLMLLGRKDSVAEDALDGSVISEFEGCDGPMTVERLKSALKAERKALHALYAELEEERSASAIAANQTMAMINRLQEEKAAMQMEALQYQRMMEEQSEYDQEALLLLNELMVKREKEKQELEKEMEIYRKKLMDYETREKVRTSRRNRDGSARSETSSACCSNTDNSDVQSIDLNQEVKEDATFDCHNENSSHHTSLDGVLNLEESLADFEEERLSVLGLLKALEEKLMTLSDGEEEHFGKVSPIENFHDENDNHLGNDYDSEGEINEYANGFHEEMNGKHYQEPSIGSNAKRLLPLFDAVNAENGDEKLNGNEYGIASNGIHKTVSKVKQENKKLEVEEEVDHLYERLQALEEDREFLKHCIGSLKKGEKGMDLLQEILQHLRDLRNVDLRARNLSDDYVTGVQ